MAHQLDMSRNEKIRVAALNAAVEMTKALSGNTQVQDLTFGQILSDFEEYIRSGGWDDTDGE